MGESFVGARCLWQLAVGKFVWNLYLGSREKQLVRFVITEYTFTYMYCAKTWRQPRGGSRLHVYYLKGPRRVLNSTHTVSLSAESLSWCFEALVEFLIFV